MISKNPYTEQIIKDYKPCNKHEILKLISLAQESFEIWKKINIEKKIDVIKTVKNNLISRKNDCALKITEEMFFLSS